MKKQSELTKKVLLSVLAAGVMSTCVMGDALAATHTDTWVVKSQTIANQTVKSDAKNTEELEQGATITDSKFLNNTFETTNKSLCGGQFRLMNTANPEKTFVNIFNTVFDGNVGTTSTDYAEVLAGAIMIKGGTSTFTDVDFDNNKIISTGADSQTGGGAIYIDAVKNSNVTEPNGDANLEFIVTNDMSYTGNTVESKDGGSIWYDTYGGLAQSKGGFLFIDRNAAVEFDVQDKATLTIGEKNAADANADTIASVVPYKGSVVDFAVIKKTGTGTLAINSSLNDYYGEMYVNEGSLVVGSDWNLHNKLVVAANAKVEAEDIVLDKISGTVEAYDTVKNKKIYTLTDTVGSLSTAAGSTLTAKDITVNSGTEVNAAGTVTADNVTVNAGGSASFSGNTTINNDLIANGATVSLNGGTDTVYSIVGKINTTDGGKVALSGGKLVKDDIKSTLSGNLELSGSGILSTKSDQVYSNAASATQKDSGAIANSNINFNGGTLNLTDAEYTVGYLDTATTALKDSTTVLNMSGKMIVENAETSSEGNTVISADTISKITENSDGVKVELDKVDVKTENNLLVGVAPENNVDSVESIAVATKVANGFSVASLVLKEDDPTNTTNGVVITNDQDVTLGGSAGGALVTVQNSSGEEQEAAKVKVVVGTTSAVTGADSQAGTLTIGNSLATADTKYNLKGEVVVNKDSKLVVNGVTNVSDAVTLNQATVAVKDGALLSTDNVNVEGNSAVTGAVSATTVDVTNGKILSIGDKDNAGKLMADEINLNGGTLFLDPAWKDGKTIGDASGAEVKDNSVLDGAYVVGQNSKLALGAGLDDLDKVFASTNQTWGKDVTAVAYIAKQISLNGEEGKKGSLTVDNAMTDTNIGDYHPTPQGINMGANSLLMVDGTAMKDTAAITGANSVTVADSSKLYIDNAQKNKVYTILTSQDINVDSYDSVWTNENLISNNSLLKLEGKQEKNSNDYNEYYVTTSLQSVKDAYGDAVITPDAYDAALNDDKSAAGKFAWNAADNNVNAGKSAQVSALNSAASMGELAGVEHGTYAASNLMTDAVSDHLSLANDRTHDSDIWAKYIHTKEDIDGLDIAGAGASYDAQFNGVVVGADLYHGGKATVGVALSYVDGNINGSTLAASTKNDATYYGASIYGGIQNADSAIVGDISYLHGKNDITQYNSGATLTADAKSDAFSIGVRAEKSFAAGAGKFVPYAGVRYMHLGTGNYINSIGMAYDGDDLNLWLLPVGVKYSANVAAGGWTIRPIAEVGYVWNLGDTDAAQTVSMSGAGNSFSYDVTDSGSYIARLALEAEKADVTYGLAYEYQKGDSVKANRWVASLNYKF